MKKTLIVIVMLCMVFILGCTSDAINPTAGPTSVVPNTNQARTTPAATPKIDPDDEQSPIPTVEEAYAKLVQFLRDFGFGDDGQFEPPPSRLKNGLWRTSFYDTSVKRGLVMLCKTEDMAHPESTIPSGGEYRLGTYAVNVIFVDVNPEYYNPENNADVPYYLVHTEETSMLYSDATVILLNGFGITNTSYPVLAPTLSWELNNYIKYDYDRIIEGEKEAGNPHSLYEIYYCDDEIVWIEQLSDLGVEGTDWEYKK